MNNTNEQNITINNYKIGVFEAIWLTIFSLFVGQIIGSIFGLMGLISPLLKGVTIAVAYAGGFGSSALIFMLVKKLSFKELLKLFHSQNKIPLFVFSAVLFFSILPFVEFTTSLIPTDVPHLKEFYDNLQKTFSSIIFNHSIAGFITICVLAPILEELIFRGILLRGLLNKKVNPWIAIVLSATLFGLCHGNPWQFVGAGILGVLFGFVYWRTKNLLICIFLHAINNSLGFFIALQNRSTEVNVFENEGSTLYIIAAISLILVIILGVQFYKYTQKKALTLWN